MHAPCTRPNAQAAPPLHPAPYGTSLLPRTGTPGARRKQWPPRGCRTAGVLRSVPQQGKYTTHGARKPFGLEGHGVRSGSGVVDRGIQGCRVNPCSVKARLISHACGTSTARRVHVRRNARTSRPQGPYLVHGISCGRPAHERVDPPLHWVQELNTPCGAVPGAGQGGGQEEGVATQQRIGVRATTKEHQERCWLPLHHRTMSAGPMASGKHDCPAQRPA